MNVYPVRKVHRLKHFDYSTPAVYFITICTAGRKKLFWDSFPHSATSPQNVPLSTLGRIVCNTIESIPAHYSFVTVDHFVVMPNHVHLLIQLHPNEDLLTSNAPSISTIINQMKGIISKQAGHSIWQKHFYDHIIRNEKEYQAIWTYIETNPLQWTDDELYIPDTEWR